MGHSTAFTLHSPCLSSSKITVLLRAWHLSVLSFLIERVASGIEGLSEPFDFDPSLGYMMPFLEVAGRTDSLFGRSQRKQYISIDAVHYLCLIKHRNFIKNEVSNRLSPPGSRFLH